jgi:hypothetical protein
MNTYENVQALKQFVIDHALPRSDMALFGIKCPYCGKSDRIRPLENPPDLPGGFDPGTVKMYTELCMDLTLPYGFLGVCKFCHNLLEIIRGRSEAQPVVSDGNEEVIR